MGKKFFKSKEVNKVVSSEVVVDSDTGEIKVETKKHKKDKEPEFVKLYLDDIGKILGLTDCERKAVIQMTCSMAYNGIIPLFGPMKEYIMAQLGINNVSLFDRRIKALKDEGILLPVVSPKSGKVMRGMYCMNPNYIAKGAWEDIKKMRLTLEYSGEGRYMTTEIVTNDTIITSTNELNKFSDFNE